MKYNVDNFQEIIIWLLQTLENSLLALIAEVVPLFIEIYGL